MSLSLNLFTSTKGHFGQKDIYLTTIKDLYNKAFYAFINKTVHIKRSVNDDAIFNEMSDNLGLLGFNVISTFGEWSHNNQSHASEYTKDIIKMFSDDRVHGCDYSFFAEDDYVLVPTYGESLYKYFDSAVNILKNNKDILSVRFNSHPYDEDKVVRKDGYLLQGENYTQWGPTFTFQPTVVRTRDMYIAYKLIEENWDRVKDMHIELTSGLFLKMLSRSKTPFAFFDYNDVKSIHIGVPNYKEVYAKI